MVFKKRKNMLERTDLSSFLCFLKDSQLEYLENKMLMSTTRISKIMVLLMYHKLKMRA